MASSANRKQFTNSQRYLLRKSVLVKKKTFSKVAGVVFIIVVVSEFFTPVLADVLSLETE